MKPLLLSILVLCTGLLYMGCKSSTEPTSVQTIKDVYPFKVGSSWTFAETENNSGTIRNDTFMFSVDGPSTMNGHSGFAVTYHDAPGFMYYSDNDVKTIADGSREIVLVRYPSEPGVDIVYRDSVYGSGYKTTNYVRRMPDLVSVTVPAGTFDCVHLHMVEIGGGPGVFDTTNIDDLYLAPGIGQVKEVSYLLPPAVSSTTIELISYK